MESPVRICIGAALVVTLLLLSTAQANAIPEGTASTKEVKPLSPRVAKVNGTTWVPRGRTPMPDAALNELKPKDQVSEEHTEQNAKYKDRGRERGKVKFNQQRTSTTESPKRKQKKPEDVAEKKPEVVYVTPEPPKKNMSQIIDSMRTYKKTKMPVVASSSTTPMPVRHDSENEEYDEDDDDDDKNDFNKFNLDKFHDNNFFSIPSFNEDITHDSYKENSDNRDYSVKPLDTYSSYFPSSYTDKPDSYFHEFGFDLTTPKNDFFDKKFHEISSSIMKNLASTKFKAPTTDKTKGEKVVKENVNLANVNNGTPNNKSTVFFKNTKEIRVLDNDGAGSSKQELSDVHGTSIYYEMSVLSTETYTIDNSNDYDCDNDTSPYEVTTLKPKTPSTVKSTVPTVFVSSSALPFTEKPFTNIRFTTPSPAVSTSPVLRSTSANSIQTTEKPPRTAYHIRNNHSKRMNITGTRGSNSVAVRDQTTANQFVRPTRKFYSTTQKNKPLWMAPRRNVTRTSHRPTAPTTIYEEHFDIKDKFTTPITRTPNKTIVTSAPSDIDPVQQSDIGGEKKVVQAQSISENSISTLWKRGSTKFSSSSSTSSSSNGETGGISDMEIPPTLTAWALASLRSPPSMASPAANSSHSSTTQKNYDDNELQKVGEITESKAIATTQIPITTPTVSDYTQKIVEINQNKLQWKPALLSTTQHKRKESSQTKSEKLPTESNISMQSSAETIAAVETVTIKVADKNDISDVTTKSPWVQINNVKIVNDTKQDLIDAENDALPPITSTKLTGFESITKLPSGLTTPQGEDMLSQKTSSEIPEIKTDIPTQKPITPKYEVTTIRFTYIPTILNTEETTEVTGEQITDTWHPIIPTRTRRPPVEEAPITTYRPVYKTTTDIIEETTNIPETTMELETETTQSDTTTEMAPTETAPTETAPTETAPTETAPTETVPTETAPTETTVELETMRHETTQIPTTTETETATMIVEVVTEINTERQTTSEEITTKLEETTTVSSEASPVPAINNDNSGTISEENIGSNEVITMETQTTTEPATENEPQTTTVDTETKIIPEPEMEQEISTQKSEENSEALPTETVREDSNENQDITEPSAEEFTTKAILPLDDLTNSIDDVTTEASSRVLASEAVPGVAIAVTVSIIGVMALILLIILLVVVRRRGRRGVYAQRCTPVSLDAYSLDSVSVGLRKGNPRMRASKRSYGNPAYDDEVTSHPMQYAALANFAMDVESITAEFTEIPSVTVRPDEVPPGCEDKNRYSNVLPLPETRVPLLRIGSDPTTEYINANFITGPGNIKNYYIACQAPLHNTVTDFWRMIWEQNSRLVVMLTEYMENGVEKCYEYLPPSEVSDNKRTFGDFQIILKKREQRDKYAISNVQLINLRTRTWREVIHLWYFWPAKGVPDDFDSVIDFLSEMRGYMKIAQTAKEYDEDGIEVIYGDQNRSSFNNLSKLREENGSNGNGANVYSPQRAEELMRRSTAHNGTLGRMKAASEIEGVRPCVVVCASGAGRAACVVALDVCARALCAGAVDVPRVVRTLRAQRPHALSNRHHYIFLYKVLSEYGNKLMGGGVDAI